ncbi:hypothetical protein FD755_015704 [Muntiacus reevesi]|uniref:G-protein coupled receptors family 1 profile domain-containing protein n=1 Tax=Muntiacus reevesi TaxID=9886 RepID=A0A5N3XG56_MUNRE|nr:hypothetical protein FD755_015704 [Muntiacus reevesi]
MRNYTEITEFILLGLSDDPQLQVVIFIFLLITYMLSITGNLTIIILTLLDIHLQTPILPQELLHIGSFIHNYKKISFNDCMAQLLLFSVIIIIFIFLGITKFYLLAAMSYDRYIAICKLLHYMTIMNHRVCTLLVLASWLTSFLIIFPLLMFFIQLDYCKSNVISRFTCDYFPLLHLSCSDTKFLEILGFSCAVFILLFTLALIILSYTYVFRTILRIPSTTQRTKAFSTSSSHMIVISISYGSCIFMYVIPSAKDRVSLSKGVAVLNISVAPMLNPFIYTLRNQQVKRAFMGMARKTMFFSRK